MLRVFSAFRELDFPQLIAVYREGNEENGAEFYPGETTDRQLQLAEEDFSRYLREVFFKIPGNVCLVWEEAGRYCSALRLEVYGDGYLVAGLETMPELRRRGYGKQLLLAAAAWLSAHHGGRLYSHVSKRNQASLATHRACGFVQVKDLVRYLDGFVSDRAVTLCLELDRI